MGIQGLLPNVKSICRKGHIKSFANQKVAVDAYVWLHRGAYSCSSELCQNIKTDRYLKYCLHMVDMMKHHKVKPVLVFDGARLPSKSGTEVDRHDRRRENMAKARQLLTIGDRSGADEHFRKAVDITPLMAYSLIEELRKKGVEYIVAPYEADAQLAYLAMSGYVSCVVTEDSDLIPYGSPRVLFKMDKYGEGLEYRLENLGVNRELDFSNFTREMLIRMCILTGCDYLNSLPGVGVKTAHKVVKEHKNLPNIMAYFRKTNIVIPDDYEESFRRAELTFWHQRVFDPITQKMIHLHPLPDGVSEHDVPFCGPAVSEDIIRGVCNGELDPTSHQPFVNSMKWTTKSSPALQVTTKPAAASSSSHFAKISTYFRPSVPVVKRPFVPPRRLGSQEASPTPSIGSKSSSSSYSTPPDTPTPESVTKKKTIIVKSRYFSQTTSQPSSQLIPSQEDKQLQSDTDSQVSTKSVDVILVEEQAPKRTSSTFVSVSDQTIPSQNSVQSLSSQESSQESQSMTPKLIKSPYFTSPLINNSVPRIGIPSKGTSASRPSTFSRFFFNARQSQSSQNTGSQDDQNRVITINDDGQSSDHAVIVEENYSSQSSFCYDYFESPPKKRPPPRNPSSSNSAADLEQQPRKKPRFDSMLKQSITPHKVVRDNENNNYDSDDEIQELHFEEESNNLKHSSTRPIPVYSLDDEDSDKEATNNNNSKKEDENDDDIVEVTSLKPTSSSSLTNIFRQLSNRSSKSL